MNVTPKFEDFQNLSKQQLETFQSVATSMTRSLQEMAVESADYSKKAFTANAALVEKMLGVRSVEGAIQIQTDYARSFYEGFTAQAAKVNALYVKLAGDVFKKAETAAAPVVEQTMG